MKKGICLGVIPGKDLKEQYLHAREFGFDSVEVGTISDPTERQRHKKFSQKHGVAVSSVMNSSHWACPLSDPDPAVRKKSLQGIADSIDTAVQLGADTVLIVPAVVTPNVTYEEAMERSKQSIQAILPNAEKQGVVLAVENVWNKFLLSPLEFTDFIDGFQTPFLRAYFDVGNIVAYGYPEHWIRTLGNRLARIHIKGFDAKRHAFVQLLAGTIDWPRVMTSLKAVGYVGYITAELSPEGTDKIKGLQQISSDMDKIISMG